MRHHLLAKEISDLKTVKSYFILNKTREILKNMWLLNVHYNAHWIKQGYTASGTRKNLQHFLNQNVKYGFLDQKQKIFFNFSLGQKIFFVRQPQSR